MSMMKNSAAALAVVSALALGVTAASAGAASHEATVKKNSGMHQRVVKQDRLSVAGWQQRDPVTGIVRGTGAFVGNVVGATGGFVSSAVSGTPYGGYDGSYGDDVRYRVGANAPAGFSGCATDDGNGRYRECEAGATGG